MLRRVNAALTNGDQTEIDRSMKWLLALPKLLLRQPRRGGERGQGSGELAARFEAVRQSSWGTLLPLLHRDEVAEKKRRDRKKQQVVREEMDPAEAEARLRKTVLSLVRRGQVGRARRRVGSYGIGTSEIQRSGKLSRQSTHPGATQCQSLCWLAPVLRVYQA